MRAVPKATYVSFRPDPDLQTRELGQAVLKSAFVRQLTIQKGETDAVLQHHTEQRKHKGHHGAADDAKLAKLLRTLETAQTPSQMPSPAEFADVPASSLVTFGKALSAVRNSKITQLKTQSTKTESIEKSSDGVGGQKFAILANVAHLGDPVNLGDLVHLAHSASAATQAFMAHLGASPIGMLNLERLEMTPAGLELGELLATIPLAPLEKTSVVQQEWSVVSQEFTSIVTDELENYSEKGVTETSELAQATTSQNAHSNQFNITASASGGCGFVSGSVASGFSSQDQSSQSATDSRKHATSVTQKASSRVKQSRKVTISSSTVSGSSETTTRSLHNSSSTEPMRVDYFSMMRKWHVGLYRYGLRLTYDLTVPEPGAALRADYKELLQRKNEAGKGFEFDLSLNSITFENYPNLITTWGAEMPDAPHVLTTTQTIGGPIEHLGTEGSSILGANLLSFSVKDGYYITSVDLDLELGHMDAKRRFDVLGVEDNTWLEQSSLTEADINENQRHHFTSLSASNHLGQPFLVGASGEQTISYIVGNTNVGSAWFTLHLALTDEYINNWKATVWKSLYNAAQTNFYARQARIQQQISDLQDKIDNVDTLTLRREENEEIMKCALRWLLGPQFEFVPENVISYLAASGGDPNHGINFTGNSTMLNTSEWSIVSQYEAIVKFINEAIEWENVIYFLYSYFWDIPTAWPFIRQLEHPDATRQAFVRAGAARVVLTIRKGYEKAWTWFAEQYDFSPPDGPWPDFPYMTIAQEIQDYDNTNYPGIPPANPNSGNTGGVDSGDPAAGTMSSAHIVPSTSLANTAVQIPVEDGTGFSVGSQVIIDSWDSKVQELQQIVAIGDNKTSITVKALKNEHDGTAKGNRPFPIMLAREKGVLIAEWFEYTPSKGTYIAINSDLKTIA
jgi:hypothetical protein